MENTLYEYDRKSARRSFRRVGLILLATMAIALLGELLVVLVPTLFLGPENWLATSSWGRWLSTIIPMYLIALPVGILLLQELPGQAPAPARLGVKNFLIFIPILLFFTFIGNLMGNIFSALLSGGQAENAVTEAIMDENPLKYVVTLILAPLFEEFLFRKQIIDHTKQYGEKTAIFLSAVAFGLFHGNFFQFFYAFGAGLIFGYIYTRTGRVRYTIALHGVLNFQGAVIAPWILSLMDTEALSKLDPNAPAEELMAIYSQVLPGILAVLGYTLLLFGLYIAGLVLFITMRKKLIWKETELQLPKGTLVKTVYLNIGVILFILLCLGLMTLSLF